MTDQLLTTQQAAKLLGVSVAFLERDRWAGARVPFIKIKSVPEQIAIAIAICSHILNRARSNPPVSTLQRKTALT